MPKIMTMKKAGELLLFTKTDDETLSFLKRKGYNEIPELDYKTMMLLRRLDPIDNWKKILASSMVTKLLKKLIYLQNLFYFHKR